MFLHFFGFIALFIISFAVLFIICDSVYFYIMLIKIKGKPEKIASNFRESSLFIKIFRDFPRLLGRFYYERYQRFDDFGIIIFYGEQGSGKTMSVVHYAQKLYCKYPSALIGSNFNLLFQDFKVKSLKDIVRNTTNRPVIFCIDELNRWAHSRNWRDTDMDTLYELCYNRKNKRVILTTAQSISQIDKQIRIQANAGEFRRCYCFGGFIHLVLRFKPKFNSEGVLERKLFRGFYMFLQDEELRYCYDTLMCIDEAYKS